MASLPQYNGPDVAVPPGMSCMAFNMVLIRSCMNHVKTSKTLLVNHVKTSKICFCESHARVVPSNKVSSFANLNTGAYN